MADTQSGDGPPRRTTPAEPGVADRYVDGSYLEAHCSWHEEDAPWKARQVLGMIRRHGLRPRSVCDIGCGTAGVLVNLIKDLPETERFVGYEPSSDAIALGESRRDRVELVAADARTCTDRFELVLMLDVFEHVDDYLGFLRDVRGTGERFMFHIPLDLSVQSVLRMTPILEARRVTGHLHYFSKETALATLEHAGYAVIDHAYTRGGIELQRESRSTRLAVVPRALAWRVAPDLAVRVLGGFSLLVLAEPGRTPG